MHSYIVEIYYNSKYVCSIGIFADNYKHLATKLKFLLKKGHLCSVIDSDGESVDLGSLGLIEVDA